MLLCVSALGQSEIPGARPAGVKHATSINATGLWPDSSEFSLSGNGYHIYQWEAAESSGHAHPDAGLSPLSGRVSFGDAYTGASAHATEMAIIMLGNASHPDSLGVAYEAQLKAFSYDGRWAEILTEAAAGMKLSVHPYAANYGWGVRSGSPFWWGLEEVDSTEDFHLGLYDAESRQWDSVAYQYPYGLFVKSAGNSRGESGSATHSYFDAVVDSITADSNYVVASDSIPRSPDGGADGYDCLPPGSVAKNILSVGAVNILNGGWGDASDVVARPASAFGPADDGRIKPDIVAAGDKTSHSAAAVAGVALLLQEHFENLYSRSPLASTLKALLIHTADEAGAHPGPDYKFGWGLVNAVNAARLVADTTGTQQVYEDTLSSGDTLYYHFYAEAGDIKATLCWTDPEGSPIPFSNSPSMLDNPTPMLVNDLDMRWLRRGSKDLALPYRLSPGSPAAAASRGDNAVDNVEQVEEELAEEGWYSLRIYHKGSLQGGAQGFSLIVSGARPGLVWDGVSWSPRAPGADTADYDVLIFRDTSVVIPPGFKARNVTIEKNAQVEVR